MRVLGVPVPVTARMPEAGEVVLGKYQITRLLGRGGVGVVFEAEHLRLRHRVAVKFLAPEMLAHPGMVERFEREARAMALFTSPYVTRVSDVDFTPEGLPFLVMELLDGHDLQSELKARGALPIGEAVHWVREACAGMAVVHGAGIVHRDLKPANLFLVGSGEARALKIMDFGISKIASEDVDVTVTTASLGTPAYMSPEQVRSAKHIDARADVWSLGVILFRALTGKLPFQGSGATGMAVAIVNDEPAAIESLRPDVPPALAAIVRRALAKVPDQRFASVGALSDALAPFDAAAPSHAIAAPTTLEAPRSDAAPSLVGQSLVAEPAPRPRGRAWLVLGGLAAASIAFAVLVFATRTPPPTAASEPPPKTVEAPAPSPSPAASAVEELEPEPLPAPASVTTPPPQATAPTKPAASAKPSAPKPVAPSPAKPSTPAPAPEKPASSPLPVLL